MDFQRYVLAWLAALLVFLAIDAIWLFFVAGEFYWKHIGEERLAAQPDFIIAAIFYLFYTMAVIILASRPAGSAQGALVLGGILGAAAYGTYDITNLATLKDWPVIVAVVDILWGTVLTGVTALVGYRVLSRP